MSSIFNGYHPENYAGPRIEEGEYKLWIESAYTRISQAGNELIEVKLMNKDRIRFFYHIVKNDNFNATLTKFYDCFGIVRGETNFNNWIKKCGKAFIAKGTPRPNGKQYMEIKYLIIEFRNHSMQNQNTTVTPSNQNNSLPDNFDDDIPF